MRKNKGFTLVELLTVLAIITILVGILVPSLNLVRKKALETKQKAQFSAIQMGILSYKNERGDYPPSEEPDTGDWNYTGAQMLAESLLGQDMLGFNKESKFSGDLSKLEYCYPQNSGWNEGQSIQDSLDDRIGPYLDADKNNAFKLETVYDVTNPAGLEGQTYVLCDSFSAAKRTLPSGKVIHVGTPILYYRANSSALEIDSVYQYIDNEFLTNEGGLGRVKDGQDHPLGDPDARGTGRQFATFYEKIKNPVASGNYDRPYNPDSYILISAGYDGLYGTEDDITNFD